MHGSDELSTIWLFYLVFATRSDELQVVHAKSLKILAF